MPFYPTQAEAYKYIAHAPYINSIGGNGAEAGSSSSKQQSTSTSGQRFSDPALVKALSGTIGGVAGNSAQQFSDYIQNPTQSPLFQQSLQTLLNDLQPGEAAQRQSLQDQFRQAGALNSGAFANAATANERNIAAQRGTTATNLLGQTYGATLQGLLGGIGQANPLINNLKLSESNSQSTGSSQAQAAPGGGGGGGSISLGQPFAPPVGTNPGQSGYYGSLQNPNPSFSGQTTITPDLANYNWGGGTPDFLNYY